MTTIIPNIIWVSKHRPVIIRHITLRLARTDSLYTAYVLQAFRLPTWEILEAKSQPCADTTGFTLHEFRTSHVKVLRPVIMIIVAQ